MTHPSPTRYTMVAQQHRQQQEISFSFLFLQFLGKLLTHFFKANSSVVFLTWEFERTLWFLYTYLGKNNNVTYNYGWIHLVHLQIHKYFTDDSSVNFHDKFFLHFLKKISKQWRKTLSCKYTDESSVKYLRIHKWTRWIRPMKMQLELIQAILLLLSIVLNSKMALTIWSNNFS